MAACTKVARWHAESVARKAHPKLDIYDAVAIGDVDSVKKGKYLVSGEVTVEAVSTNLDYVYSCQYDPADHGGSSKIVEFAPKT